MAGAFFWRERPRPQVMHGLSARPPAASQNALRASRSPQQAACFQAPACSAAGSKVLPHFLNVIGREDAPSSYRRRFPCSRPWGQGRANWSQPNGCETKQATQWHLWFGPCTALLPIFPCPQTLPDPRAARRRGASRSARIKPNIPSSLVSAPWVLTGSVLISSVY